MSRNILARKKYSTKEVWLTLDFAIYFGKYVIIHYLDNKTMFGEDCIVCSNLSELNDAKSSLLNNGFKINWDSFNAALKYID